MNSIAADPGPVAVRPRNVEFDCSGAPLQWIPEHPVSSHFVSAFNLILPECEEWFVRVFSEALGYVDDENLRETMRGFIGQEAQVLRSPRSRCGGRCTPTPSSASPPTSGGCCGRC